MLQPLDDEDNLVPNLQCSLACYSAPGLCVLEVCLSPSCSLALTFTPGPSCCSQINSYIRGSGLVLPDLSNPLICINYLTLYIMSGTEATEPPNRDI